MTGTRANFGGLDLHLDLDPGGRGVRGELERGLRDAVRTGQLAPGATLPPSRSLSGDLGVARNTVAEAYAQLVGEGWLVARQGSGTRVASRPPVAPATARPVAGDAAPARYDLRAGFPDVTSFPRAEWMSALRSALADAPDSALGYGPLAGHPTLRSALAEYLGRARGVHADADAVVVCAGYTAGLRIVANVLRQQGIRRIAIERYGHASHHAILRGAGLEPVALDVDGDGAVPDGLHRVGAALLTPAHQFPLGVALSPVRRAAFTAWAARGGVLIEDDYDGEFRYDRRALGAVQALAPDDVIYAGTASKTLAPGLRLGWLAVPQRLRAAVVAEQAVGHAQPAAIEQLTLARFFETGRYDRHVRRARLAYRNRRLRLARGLARRVPHLALSGMDAGLQAAIVLPPGVTERDVIARARARELALEGLGGFDALPGDDDGRQALIVGYGTPAPRAYTAALARLFTTLAE